MDLSEFTAALRRLKLVSDGEAVHLSPLTGGVSSDIHLVEAGARRFCVKRALERLKVSAVWEAPLERNAAEAAWMRRVGQWLPRAVPTILAEEEALGFFAMTYLPPEDNPVWKAELLRGAVDQTFAEQVGRDLATIHARSAADPSVAAAFANEDTFEQIRIDPYLRATGRAHLDLGARFDALAETTVSTKRALMHGDISPKNILHAATGPVFLDAECACFGDPAFDLAFCLNHLLLKGARAGATRAPYNEAFRRLSAAYLAGAVWEPREEVEKRAAALLPALMLARVDGKSPVEYLTRDDEKSAVRRFATPFILAPPPALSTIVDQWSAAS